MSRCCDIPFCIALMLAFAATAAAQGFKWECDPTERHSRFYRADLGIVCWEGKTFSKDNGGIPQYMLDYFEKNRREVQQKVDEMNKHFAELKAAHAGNSGTLRPVTPPANATGPAKATASANTTGIVARAEAVPIVPVSPEVFASIDVGMPRSAVLDKLGKPPGSITIPGDDGFVEIWTYQLADGSTAKLNIEKGVVTSRDPSREPKTAEHE
jgi:hypothetical protein